MFKFKNEYEHKIWGKNEPNRPEKLEQETHHRTGENQKQHGPAQFRS
jgi:hypothetical protein